MPESITKSNGRILFVDFGEENCADLLEWKKRCMGKEGKGAVTNRAISLIKNDLEKMRDEKND